ncbi:mechanosensitive ion channel family protein [Deefgea sp. CFH1-16]|uniref:mechanosensitive ion channel family protein n=1 Tax=Deefgea sp. CFH1-16 TaxID=2675457 RepID=UPI0024944177|nr:mechanosensitive ion channel family protein [Deefgea sp. CFH1-16]
MKKVLQILENIATSYPGLDQNQTPFIHVMSYGDSSINILFMVWTDRAHYYQVRGELMAFLLEKLTQEGVDIPFNILMSALPTNPSAIKPSQINMRALELATEQSLTQAKPLVCPRKSCPNDGKASPS